MAETLRRTARPDGQPLGREDREQPLRGQNLQPLRGEIANPATGITYGADGLYAGEAFYATTEHIYNRTWVGYDRRFFKDTMHVEAGMVFHYDGTGLGTQQVVKLSVDIQKLFDVGPKQRN